MTMRKTFAIAGLSAILVQYVQAGLLDQPPPMLSGVLSQVIYRMGPIYFRAGQLDTVITCTNHDNIPAIVALELFDGSDGQTGTLATADVAASGSFAFATSLVPAIENLVVVQNLPTIDHGKARLSATTAKLSCTGYHRIRSEDGSVTEQALALIKNVSRNNVR